MRLFVSFPEQLVNRPLIYEVIREFDVVPNIRRANVEDHSGWIILEMNGEQAKLDAAVSYLEEAGCTVNRMEGDVLES
jgi:ABC-type methionine transport system ATPase subunit